jgi:PadR family transcriptional regulator, regulatory protein PadR
MPPKTDALRGSLDLLVLVLNGGHDGVAVQPGTTREYLIPPGSCAWRRAPFNPALHRMEESGWIRPEWVIKENGRRARVYELTTAGKKQLGMEESQWKVVAAAVNRVLGGLTCRSGAASLICFVETA